jgi:hypothetical protein
MFGDRDSEQRAEEHIKIADELQSECRWGEAAMEYAIVAEHYSNTRFYEAAVRKAAILFVHPDNPAANDSASLRWLSDYQDLSLSEEEQLNLEVLRALIQYRKLTADSLTRVILAQSRQIEELKKVQKEFAKINEELSKLREIDLEVSRSRDKKD